MPDTQTSLVSAYKNPFDQNVLDSAIRDIGDATTKRRNQLGTEAFASGAFGDARHGIESANLTEDALKTIGDFSGKLNREGYESAMGWLNTDLDRQTNTGFQNAMLDQNWLNSQIGLLNLGSNLGQLDLTNAMGFSDALMALDQYDRDIAQQGLNVGFEDWLAQQGWDSNQVNQLLGVLTAQPQATQTTSQTPNNQWAGLLGSALGSLFGN